MSLIGLIGKYIARFRGGAAWIGYLRRQGMTIGEGARIFSDISTTESYLIEIGDNTTVSNDVQFITHDASVAKALDGVTDLFGKIVIGSRCFIGARSIVMYGVSLPDNTIVAAGSVVTKSIDRPGMILGGNPAKIIGTVKDFGEKSASCAVNIRGLSAEEKKQLLSDEANLVRR